MVFNATFNNISVISWWSVFISGGNQRTRRKPPTCRKSLTNLMLYRTGFELTTLVVIATDCTGICKSNYHTITTTTARPHEIRKGLQSSHVFKTTCNV